MSDAKPLAPDEERSLREGGLIQSPCTMARVWATIDAERAGGDTRWSLVRAIKELHAASEKLAAAERERDEVLELLGTRTIEHDELRRTNESAGRALSALRDQIEHEGCAASHAGETTYNCRADSPCGLCRLRNRAEAAERERDKAIAERDEAREALREPDAGSWVVPGENIRAKNSL